MDAHQFVNRIRSLWNLDWDDVSFLDRADWIDFRDSPVRFITRCDDQTRDRIYAAVEARQRT